MKNTLDKSTVSALQTYVDNAKRDLISACANGLKAGACISAMATDSGMQISAVISMLDLGVSSRTLYRWCVAYNNSLKIINVDYIPSFNGEEWDAHMTELDGVAQGMSLSRLQLGAPAEKSDIARLDTLQLGVETAENEEEEAIYNNALEQVESGKWTLIEALRAVGSQTSKSFATEKRKSPVYIEIDEETEKPTGILVKTISSLKTGFKNWQNFDSESKRAFAYLWKELVEEIPADLKKFMK
ncbi:MAG: hypothetical protein RR250_02820 [Akkermansia sp.]